MNKSSRKLFDPNKPIRTHRPASARIVFIATEGQVTEFEYFNIVMDIYTAIEPNIKSKFQFINVMGDILNMPYRSRTEAENRELSRTRPLQLLERINNFKINKQDEYEFDKHPDDEFFIVCDVDKNWSNDMITREKTYHDEWREVITECQQKNYQYVISNPFFEVWLLLHHDEVIDEDKKYAVTDTHSYARTTHFGDRMRSLGINFKNKHLKAFDYNREKIQDAIRRAKNLHTDKTDMQPKYLMSTVYLLLQRIEDVVSAGL